MCRESPTCGTANAKFHGQAPVAGANVRTLPTWAAGRTFIWVDDEITEADRAWVAARHPGDALVHRVEANVGLTDSDLMVVERWLALRGQLVVPVWELAGRVQLLLDELCIDLGFCLPPLDQSRLCHEPPLDPDAFVDAVFAAEGIAPHLNSQLRRKVKDQVANRMPDIMGAFRRGGQVRDEGPHGAAVTAEQPQKRLRAVVTHRGRQRVARIDGRLNV